VIPVELVPKLTGGDSDSGCHVARYSDLMDRTPA
jgi:hypothetical protein